MYINDLVAEGKSIIIIYSKMPEILGMSDRIYAMNQDCIVGATAGIVMANCKMNIGLAIVICLIIGVVVEMLQGFWIAYIRIPVFLVILAGMLLWRGGTLVLLGIVVHILFLRWWGLSFTCSWWKWKSNEALRYQYQ